MSNIEIPEEIKANAQRVLDGRENFISSTVEMAEFIRDLNKPEIKVEPFVVYKVKVRGDDNYRIGFRVKKDVPYPWIILNMDSTNKDTAYPVSAYNQTHKDEAIKVLERWTPDAPQPEFGIGDDDRRVEAGREVLVKGVLYSTYADGDGDTLVTFRYSGDATESHYVNTADIAYADGGR